MKFYGGPSDDNECTTCIGLCTHAINDGDSMRPKPTPPKERPQPTSAPRMPIAFAIGDHVRSESKHLRYGQTGVVMWFEWRDAMAFYRVQFADGVALTISEGGLTLARRD